MVCLTTGHLLKDPDAAFEAGGDPEPVANDAEAVLDLITSGSPSPLQAVSRRISKATRSTALPAVIGGGLALAYLGYRKLRSAR